MINDGVQSASIERERPPLLNSSHLPIELQPVGTRCHCVATHNPPSLVFEKHHIWPKEFGGPTTPENLVYVCATTHNNVHAYLRCFVAAGRILLWNELRYVADGKPEGWLAEYNYPPHINEYAYELAKKGFNEMLDAGVL